MQFASTSHLNLNWSDEITANFANLITIMIFVLYNIIIKLSNIIYR